jgi:hypothetical protein
MSKLFDISSLSGAVLLPSDPETPITTEDILALALLFGSGSSETSETSETSEEGGEAA